ncbi:hypothetical protein HK098_002509 [Nowakowskiella sp. JEL0407]|nr:hypothetical protein HK098_002509 [Nowakowskiella sp. JEL0407]
MNSPTLNPITFRDWATLVSYDDSIIIIGGDSLTSQQNYTIAEGTILMFNTTASRFSILLTRSPNPSISIPNPGGSVTAQIIENYLWIFGGDNSVAAGTATAMYSLGPLSNIKSGKALIWNRFPISANFSVHNTRSASVVWNKELYLYGEYWSKTTAPPPRTGKTWIYSPSSNQWREGVPLPVPDHSFFTATISPEGQVFSFGGWEIATAETNFAFTGRIGEPLNKVSTNPLSIPRRVRSCVTNYKNNFIVYAGLIGGNSTESPLVAYWWDGNEGSAWSNKTTKVSSNDLTIPKWFSTSCARINDTLYVFGTPSDETARVANEATQRYIYALNLDTLEWFDPAERSPVAISEPTPPYVFIGIVFLAIIAILIVALAILALKYRTLRLLIQSQTEQLNEQEQRTGMLQWRKQGMTGSYQQIPSLTSGNDVVEVVDMNALNLTRSIALSGSLLSGYARHWEE